MCRSIKLLHNLAPPASEQELREAALQYVRKISGSRRPSQANAAAFEQAVEEVTAASARLLAALVTPAPPRDRALLAAQAKARGQARRAAGA